MTISMEHTDFRTFESLKEEIARMRSDLSLIIEYIEATKDKWRTAEERQSSDKQYEMETQLSARSLVTNREAADILLISTRQLQRIRTRLCLRWVRTGRETHYYLRDIVTAINTTNCRWDSAAYEKVLRRLTRRPRPCR